MVECNDNADAEFVAGTHVLEASIVPTVNFYIGSQSNSSFDSRGFSTIMFLKPSLDALGQPSLNDRTIRGDLLEVRILLEDNTGAPIDGQQVTLSLLLLKRLMRSRSQ